MTNTIEEQAKTAPPLDAILMQMLSGLWVSKAIGVFAELGLADLMADGAKTAAEVAAKAELHEDSVFRLLRMLAGVGVLTEVDPHSFALTPLSDLLRSGVPGSKRAIATSLTSGEHYDAWGELAHSVRTGQMGVEAALGMDVWQHFRQNAERNEIFNAAMTDFSTMSDATIADSFDFSPYKQICDIGGGLGSQLLAILERNPQALGIIYDQPHVAEAANRRFAELGVIGKATAIGGDFFQSIPQGPEVFLAKNIIHDWDDARSITILKRVREVIPAHGRMLLLELTIQPAGAPHVGRILDVHMQVMTGGRERTEAEFAALFAASGFRLGRVIPTQSPVFIVEGIPA